MADDDGSQGSRGSNATNSRSAGGDDEIAAYEKAQVLEKERQEREKVLMSSTKNVFAVLFEDYPFEVSNEISRTCREELGFLSNPVLSYSEAPYEEIFKQIVKLYRLGFTIESEGHFIDLGSGSGTVAFTAVLSHDFTAVTGIEIVDSLHSVAEELNEEWDGIKNVLPTKKQDTIVKFQHGDCCHVDWSHGDVIYCNATCFDEKAVEKIAELAWNLKPSAFFIMITKKMPPSSSLYFEFVDAGSIKMNWGIAPVHFYKRNRISKPNYIADRAQFVDYIISQKAIPKYKSKPLL